MSECTGKFYIRDGLLMESGSFNTSMVYEGEVIYEVLRVIDGIPLFLDDHIERMDDSLKLSNHEALASKAELLNYIQMLVKENNITNGNVKIIYNYNSSGNYLMVYFIEAQYPDSQMYGSGVDTILFDAERKNPGAKVFNFRLRSTILDSLVRRSAYEALLVNRNGCITEGSRSNVYFISGNRVITAGDEFVLGGITRKYVNSLCTERDIRLEYRCMPVVELKTVEAVFLSGTSPHLLPVRSIDKYKFRVEHPVLRTLIDAYQDKVKSYISLRREIE